MFGIHKNINFHQKGWKPRSKIEETTRKHPPMQFFYQIWVPHMDVKTCSRGVKTRKPFRLRSDYRLRLNYVQLRSTCAIYIIEIRKNTSFVRNPYFVQKWHWKGFSCFCSILELGFQPFWWKLIFLWITNILFSGVFSYTRQFWRGFPDI